MPYSNNDYLDDLESLSDSLPHQDYLMTAIDHNVTVVVNRSMVTVSIIGDDGLDYFLQGYEAEEWIDGLDKLIDEFPDTSFHALELISSYPYLDLYQ